jgi:DNA-binding beta-propeller fold protein YncE
MKASTPFLALLLITAACSDPGAEVEETPEVPCEGKGNICTAVGDGRRALGDDGVAAEEVSLYLPQDMTVGPDGRLYVIDWNNHRVRVLTEDGTIETVAGNGELGEAPDGKASKTQLNHPTHIAFAPDGTMILSAWHNSKVMELDLKADSIKAICGTGDRSFGGEGGPAAAAILDLPVATAFDSDGRMYIMDQGNQRIRRVESDGVLNTLVGPVGPYVPDGFQQVCTPPVEEGQAEVCVFCKADVPEGEPCVGPPARPQGFAGEGEDGTAAFMNQPFGQSAPPAGRMEMGPEDVLYFTDSANHIVRALDPDGTVRTVFGTTPENYDATELMTKAPRGDYDGDGTDEPLEAKLNSPRDVAVAADGTLYVADTMNSCVRKLSPNGRVSTVAGICGERGYNGDGGPADEALLDQPYGVALDEDGNLYIADTHNDRIRVVYAE